MKVGTRSQTGGPIHAPAAPWANENAGANVSGDRQSVLRLPIDIAPTETAKTEVVAYITICRTSGRFEPDLYAAIMTARVAVIHPSVLKITT
jgi:hypothetical protein